VLGRKELLTACSPFISSWNFKQNNKGCALPFMKSNKVMPGVSKKSYHTLSYRYKKYGAHSVKPYKLSRLKIAFIFSTTLWLLLVLRMSVQSVAFPSTS
jgi:hypothetical protein